MAKSSAMGSGRNLSRQSDISARHHDHRDVRSGLWKLLACKTKTLPMVHHDIGRLEPFSAPGQ
ncbi:hypothetical protein, partial [Acinetobacter baumannii]|uniref:hypothetical protein n=1 Tax=Acinetobacter baumannii TaxID=470 RepID=UPI001C09A7F0